MSFKKILLTLLLTFIAFLLIAMLILRTRNQPSQQTSTQQQAPQKGFSLSPKSFESNDFANFFQVATQGGTVIGWYGDWNELSKANSAPATVVQLSSQYNYTPVIVVQFFTQATGKLLRPLDATTKQRYQDNAVEFVKKYPVTYLGIGIEVNILYEKSPEDFTEYVNLFADTYQAVKSQSPNTLIFPVFQLEKMKGLHGGLFGGRNDPTQAEWALLEQFPQADAIGFSTYPGLIYKSPDDIPSDYYTEIASHTTKPILLTEIGWHSAAEPTGWESSEPEQARFIQIFAERIQTISPRLTIWSFLYDQDTQELFSSMGLWSRHNIPKQAWDTWLAFQPQMR